MDQLYSNNDAASFSNDLAIRPGKGTFFLRRDRASLAWPNVSRLGPSFGWVHLSVGLILSPDRSPEANLSVNMLWMGC